MRNVSDIEVVAIMVIVAATAALILKIAML